MNFLALYPEEIIDERALLRGNRARYVRLIHRVAPKKKYSLVLLNYGHALGEILSDDGEEIQIHLTQVTQKSCPPDIRLIVGVCRPQTVRKVLQAGVSFGVREILFIAAAYSEKSYFTSKPLIDHEVQERLLLESVEQTGNCFLPTVQLEQKFRPFVEDRLQPMIQSGELVGLMADQHGTQSGLLEAALGANSVAVLIGPEKGWSKFEVELLASIGCLSYRLGDLMLRVEVATIAMLSRLRQYHP